jgi:hypothetical protein
MTLENMVDILIKDKAELNKYVSREKLYKLMLVLKDSLVEEK